MGVKKIKQVIGVAVSSLGLVAGLSGGLASAQSGTIGTTGPDSTNKIIFTTSQDITAVNNNDLSASNSSDQSARSGRAEVEGNTTGGDARSGSVSTGSGFSANVVVDNSGSGLADMTEGAGSGPVTGTISNTGPDSTNKIIVKSDSDVSITNNNVLTVSNTDTQSATSGSAEVNGNTTGGNATTGNASNSSSSTLTFRVTN